MNWGHKLTVGMIAFMLFITYMVYRMASSSVDLVADDYYEDGVEYQQRIEKIKNAEKLGDSLNVGFNSESNELSVAGPSTAQGKVYFYNAADRKNDFNVDFAGKSLLVSFAGKPKGVWKVSLDGTDKGVAFFYEKEFLVK